MSHDVTEHPAFFLDMVSDKNNILDRAHINLAY